MGPQAVFQLLVQIADALGDLDAFAAIIFQDLIYGFPGGDPLVIQVIRPALPQHDGGHPKNGVFQYFLIRQLSLPDLFVKPTHSPPPQSLQTSSV